MSTATVLDEVVLGRAEDAIDYAAYCSGHGIRPTFLEPGPDVAHTGPAMLEWLESHLGEAAHDIGSVISFRDAFQAPADCLREALGLRHRRVDSVRCLTDKTLFKSHPAVRPHVADFVVVGLDAEYARFREEVLGELDFPLVLKPSNGFYSAGVVRVDAESQLRRAWTSVRRVCSVIRRSRGSSSIHAERFLDGTEIMADGFVVGGVVRPLLHHHKLPDITGIPTFHETGCVTRPFDAERDHRMVAMLQSVVTGVGLDDSAFNAEFRYDAQGRLHLLEIGPRLSGGGASVQHLLRLCTGLDAYAIEHRILQGDPAVAADGLVPVDSGCALEYDFCADANGYLQGTGPLAQRLRELGMDTLLQYRSDGDYVFAPPMNVETVMTAFFRCASTEAARTLLDVIGRTCRIDTSDSPAP